MFHFIVFALFIENSFGLKTINGRARTITILKSSVIPPQGDPLKSSLGSDVLFRPEDENSPEFKEYLKTLLRLQANRAKTGFTAASSGSSDAYFAKLNRLKLEKLARWRAGLPDVALDTSYREEDYKASV
jgi:hypothetical protein